MLRTAMGASIARWLAEPAVIEVMLNPDGRLWVDRLGEGMADSGERLTPADGERIIRLVAHHVGIEVHARAPRVSAELPETGERFEGLLPPVVTAPAFAIRKPAVAVFTLDDYADAKIMSRLQAAVLRSGVATRENILVAGGTGTGKTTLANALLAEVAKTTDRVVLIEDTRELQCAAPNLVAMRTKDGVASLSELVRSSLRLRPDRTVEQMVASDPADFRLRGAQPTVTRLSPKALAVIGVAAGLGIGGSLIYALQPRGTTAPAQNLYSDDHNTKANAVTAAPADYSKVPKLGPPLPGDLGRPILNAQANGQVVPVPPMGAPTAASPDPRAAAVDQARQRVVQERDSARTSSLFLGGANAGGANGTAPPAPPTASMSTGSASDATPPASAPAPAGQAANRAFLQVEANRTVASSERVTAPISPFVLQAGSIIPAALITGIRSDLPGQITAQVTQNVFDSPTGRILLIPQGSRLIGGYDSDVSSGQNRLLLAWDRLILPGGRSILLDRQPSVDAAGMAGLQDRTNYHWGNMLKAALVSTLLGVGTEFATDGDDRLTQALRNGTQDTINQSGQKLVQRKINVPPTLTIRPGFPLRVIVTRDLVIDTEGGKP